MAIYHKPQFVRDIDNEKLDLARCDWTTNVFMPPADMEILWPVTLVQEFRCQCGELRYASEVLVDPYEHGPYFDGINYTCPKCNAYYKKMWRVPAEQRTRFGFIPALSTWDHNHMYAPEGAPIYDGKPGKIEMKVQQRKVCEPGTLEHKLFGDWSDFEAIRGNEQQYMEIHIRRAFDWLRHYHTYYNMPSWELRVMRKLPGQGVEYAENPSVRESEAR